jgi:hypothetical protein
VKGKFKWQNVVFITGVASLIFGVIDPLEGSILIAFGSICLAISTFFMHDRFHRIFVFAAILVLAGVGALWFISSQGGYDPKKEWWWNIFILPYPVGWLISIISLMVRFVKRKDRPETRN